MTLVVRVNLMVPEAVMRKRDVLRTQERGQRAALEALAECQSFGCAAYGRFVLPDSGNRSSTRICQMISIFAQLNVHFSEATSINPHHRRANLS